jgi:lipopolysaccharide transport system ATP-binding protein
MSDTVVRVENLSKKYIIGHQPKEQNITLRDAISSSTKGLLKPFQRDKSQITEPTLEEFWALKDVSFEIKQGDRLGIIGRNGAGKSTLLKILSRIVEPTNGSIRIIGRVSSLLEVGTGFHPELTGRENISLNGAILGMSKSEITQKFDEIVAFAEVEKFLDTPVKRYSSGMYVRLAFSVAAHLEPEILIVDEVLAVGDAQFQKKCLGKMESVGKEGRTIIFVSHNILAIRQLCDKGLFLENGQLVAQGQIQDVVNHYVDSKLTNSSYWSRNVKIPESFGIFFEEVSVTNSTGKVADVIRGNEDFHLNILTRTLGFVEKGAITVRVVNKEDIAIFTTATSDLERKWLSFEEGIHQHRIKISSDFLYPGRYSLILASFVTGQLFDLLDGKICFEIDEVGNIVTDIGDNRIGFVSPRLKWEVLSNAL